MSEMPEMIDEEDIELLELPIPTDPKKRQYVDNEKLSAMLGVWADERRLAIKENREIPRLPEYIGVCLLDIATNYAKKHNFSGYSFKQEMISDAIENVLLYIGNYDASAPTKAGKPNAFGYISRTVHFAFTRRIQFEARETYYKYKSYELNGGAAMFEGEGEEELGEIGISDPHSIHADFMQKIYEYEEKQEKKKQEAKKMEASKQVPKSSLLDFLG